MRELDYPFDSELLLKRKKQIKKELLSLDDKQLRILSLLWSYFYLTME